MILLNDLYTLISESVPGRMMSSEWVLARKYGISRNTVSKVFKILVQDGLVERQVGRGTLVKGQSTITFLLPCPDFLSCQTASAHILRQRMQGAMTVAQKRGLGFETIAVTQTNRPNQIDYAALARINAGSMVILDIWFWNIFQLLSNRRARVALIAKNEIPYGFAQYTRSWHLLNLNCDKAVKSAMDYLVANGCRKIALIGLWIDEPRHPIMATYRDYVSACGMKELSYPLPTNEDIFMRLPPTDELRAFYEREPFDGVLLGSGYYADSRSIQELLGVPESVKVCGIDQNAMQVPYKKRYAYFTAPNVQMGYDAAAMLGDNPGGQCQSREYDYLFCPE